MIRHPIAMHYLNHAACGPMSDATRQTIDDYLQREQQLGGYGAARLMQPQLEDVYRGIAQAIHAQPKDIALTQGNSDGWSRIISAMDWRAGGRILVASNEWGGNLGLLMQLRQQYGVQIEAMSCDAQGLINLDALAQQLATPASLVVITWFSAHRPLVQPAQAIGALCMQAQTPLLIDAAQAMGQYPVDVQALQCAALTAAGRKWLRGPRGTGFVYVRPDFLELLQPLVADHFSRPWQEDQGRYRPDARRLEPAESSMALRLGLGSAMQEWAALDLPQVQNAIAQRAQWLREALQGLPGVQVHAAAGHACSGIVTLQCNPAQHKALHAALLQQGIECALCPAAFTPWAMQAQQLPSVLRFSVGHDTPWESLRAGFEILQTALIRT